jgi:hypothetical protein
METLMRTILFRRVIVVMSLVLVGMVFSACSPDFPLAEPGPYAVSQVSVETVDPARGNRPVGITYWYPAEKQKGVKTDLNQTAQNLPPGRSGAPYPLFYENGKYISPLPGFW